MRRERSGNPAGGGDSDAIRSNAFQSLTESVKLVSTCNETIQLRGKNRRVALLKTSPKSFADPSRRGRGVTAVLGPTNTGKTHLAIDRMLAHSSGLIGLPLRLLAREVYQRCVARVGAENVALITGEEKIRPKESPLLGLDRRGHAEESPTSLSPRSTKCSSPPFERGHLFTDRILNLRGARRRGCSVPRPCAALSASSCRASM